MTTKLFGNKIIRLDSVTSTNVYLINLLKKGFLQEGTLEISDNQYAGKGLDKNVWESEKGKNLTFSVVLYPDFLPAEKQFMLTKAISLAVCRFIKMYIADEHVKIKWPNDIYIKNQKVAGILINNSIQGSQMIYSVVGIGININQTVFLSDAPNPVSLAIKNNKIYDLEDCLNQLCGCLDTFYYSLQKKKNGKQLTENTLLVYININFPKPIITREKKIQATITGISTFGKLQLTIISGEKIECDLKEIGFIVQ